MKTRCRLMDGKQSLLRFLRGGLAVVALAALGVVVFGGCETTGATDTALVDRAPATDPFAEQEAVSDDYTGRPAALLTVLEAASMAPIKVFWQIGPLVARVGSTVPTEEPVGPDREADIRAVVSFGSLDIAETASAASADFVIAVAPAYRVDRRGTALEITYTYDFSLIEQSSDVIRARDRFQRVALRDPDAAARRLLVKNSWD